MARHGMTSTKIAQKQPTSKAQLIIGVNEQHQRARQMAPIEILRQCGVSKAWHQNRRRSDDHREAFNFE